MGASPGRILLGDRLYGALDVVTKGRVVTVTGFAGGEAQGWRRRGAVSSKGRNCATHPKESVRNLKAFLETGIFRQGRRPRCLRRFDCLAKVDNVPEDAQNRP